jgi:ABC-type sugar transport system substrate-binding protein
MRGKRAVSGLLAASVTAVALVVVPALSAAPNDPTPKTSGEHIAYTFCHRTGSLSNPFVVITTDDAAWAEAHMPGTDPAHPPLNGNDDIFIGINLDPKKVSDAVCEGKEPPK